MPISFSGDAVQRCSARRRIRGLVKLMEKTKTAIVYTNFADELGDGSIITLGPVQVGTNWERFNAKARANLKDHDDHVALQRLRRNKRLQQLLQ